MKAGDCGLDIERHVPAKAKYPAVDVHNHLWGDPADPAELFETLSSCGIVAFFDLTANVKISWSGGGYEFERRDLAHFIERWQKPFGGMFNFFTAATFSDPPGKPLFSDPVEFQERTVSMLREHVGKGAMGLKILKELGLRHRDAKGKLLFIDDAVFEPVWDECARLGIPVLAHQADMLGVFQPPGPGNEHSGTLAKYPSWGFYGPEFPSHGELLRRMAALVRRRRDLTFILPHVANFPESLEYVSELLDGNPNVYIDLSARADELGRQPYMARDFVIRHQDRVLFGSDMPVSTEMYRFHFQFLETFDEFVVPPDYDGTFGRHRWRVHCLGLPDGALKKIYHGNALKLFPKLAAQVDGASFRA